MTTLYDYYLSIYKQTTELSINHYYVNSAIHNLCYDPTNETFYNEFIKIQKSGIELLQDLTYTPSYRLQTNLTVPTLGQLKVKTDTTNTVNKTNTINGTIPIKGTIFHPTTFIPIHGIPDMTEGQNKQYSLQLTKLVKNFNKRARPIIRLTEGNLKDDRLADKTFGNRSRYQKSQTDPKTILEILSKPSPKKEDILFIFSEGSKSQTGYAIYNRSYETSISRLIKHNRKRLILELYLNDATQGDTKNDNPSQQKDHTSQNELST